MKALAGHDILKAPGSVLRALLRPQFDIVQRGNYGYWLRMVIYTGLQWS